MKYGGGGGMDEAAVGCEEEQLDRSNNR